MVSFFSPSIQDPVFWASSSGSNSGGCSAQYQIINFHACRVSTILYSGLYTPIDPVVVLSSQLVNLFSTGLVGLIEIVSVVIYSF